MLLSPCWWWLVMQASISNCAPLFDGVVVVAAWSRWAVVSPTWIVPSNWGRQVEKGELPKNEWKWIDRPRATNGKWTWAAAIAVGRERMKERKREREREVAHCEVGSELKPTTAVTEEKEGGLCLWRRLGAICTQSVWLARVLDRWQSWLNLQLIATANNHYMIAT